MPRACPWSAAVPQDGAECVEDGWVVDGGGYGRSVAVGDAAHGLAQYLARAGLGQPGDDVDPAEGGDGADLVADQLDEFGAQRLGVGVDARLEHDEPAGDLALQ